MTSRRCQPLTILISGLFLCRVTMAADAAALTAIVTATTPSTNAAVPAAAVTPNVNSRADRQWDRIRIARENGFWVVMAGDHVYAIARLLGKTENDIAAIAREMRQQNPQAFLPRSADKLRIGATLVLPARYWLTPEGGNTVHQSKPSQERDNPQSTFAAPHKNGNAAKQAAASTPIPTRGRYQDRLINDAVINQTEVEQTSLVEPAGLRSFSVEYRAEQRDDIRAGAQQPRALEQGALLRYQRETLNYGVLGVEAVIRDSNNTRQIQPGRGHFSITQQAFPLTGAWEADSTLGIVRLGANAQIASSYRVSLPSPTLVGAASVMRTDQREIRVITGQPGEFVGAAVPIFESRAGAITQLGYQQRISSSSQLAAHMVNVRNSDLSPDHTSVSAVLSFGERSHLRGKAQLASDDRGKWGAWIDNDITAGRDRHRLGAYWITPGFTWADIGVVNDIAGAYWRGDFRARDRNIYAGAEWSMTNLENKTTSAGSVNASAFAGLTLKISRAINIGGTVSAQQSRNRPSTTETRNSGTLSAYSAIQTPLGSLRIEQNLSAARRKNITDPTPGIVTTTSLLREDNRASATTISQDWQIDQWLGDAYGLSTSLSRVRDRLQGINSTRDAATLNARGPLFGSAFWDVSLTRATNKTQNLGIDKTEKNINIAASLNWRLARNWVIATSYIRNSIDTSTPPLLISPGLPAPVALTPFTLEKRWQINIRYDDVGGTPLFALGKPTGLVGSGDITGMLFYDENADGVRQTNEKGAVNIPILLDGRIPVSTDREGRFSFSAVRAGGHTIQVAVERLPLPWGLADDNAVKRIDVPLRAEVNVLIPLTKSPG